MEMSIDEIMEIVEEEDFDVTLSGGDPLYHPEEVAELARRIREVGHTVWLYTGFTYQEIMETPRLRSAITDIETIVDGPYIESQRDPDLKFRGSTNQNIIYINKPSDRE